MSEIVNLTENVVQSFHLNDNSSNTKTSQGQGPSIQNGLAIEIVSAKGLALPLEHIEQLQSL